MKRYVHGLFLMLAWGVYAEVNGVGQESQPIDPPLSSAPKEYLTAPGPNIVGGYQENQHQPTEKNYQYQTNLVQQPSQYVYAAQDQRIPTYPPEKLQQVNYDQSAYNYVQHNQPNQVYNPQSTVSNQQHIVPSQPHNVPTSAYYPPQGLIVPYGRQGKNDVEYRPVNYGQENVIAHPYIPPLQNPGNPPTQGLPVGSEFVHRQISDAYTAPGQQHGINYPQHGVSYQQPAVTYQQPAVTYQQPAVAYQQPAVTYQQPAVTYQQPKFTYPQHGVPYQHHGQGDLPSPPTTSYAPLHYSPKPLFQNPPPIPPTPFAENPDVKVANALHFEALKRAELKATEGPSSVAPQEKERPPETGAPLNPDGTVADTPEVKAAKELHFQLVREAAQKAEEAKRNGVGPGDYDRGDYDDSSSNSIGRPHQPSHIPMRHKRYSKTVDHDYAMVYFEEFL